MKKIISIMILIFLPALYLMYKEENNTQKCMQAIVNNMQWAICEDEKGRVILTENEQEKKLLGF